MKTKSKKNKTRKCLKIMLIVIGIVVLLLLSIFINHRIRLSNEAKLLAPLGKTVDVDGHKMSVYTEGSGDVTLVFMSGGGTCSPILDFKSLYSRLSGKYTIAVVEKFGYGFSEVYDKNRDIDSVLSDTRTALKAAGVNAPYVLCPHSLSGIEALYWAQQYPDEVKAVVGLDMSVPDAYKDYKLNMPLLKLGQFAANIGITRLIPGIADGDAVKYGTLSDSEKDIYRAVFFSRTATQPMLTEVKQIKKSAEKVDSGDFPDIPILMFVSNGEGTGWDKEKWIGFQESFIKNFEHGKLIKYDCPHYIHDHEYEAISEQITDFLNTTAA